MLHKKYFLFLLVFLILFGFATYILFGIKDKPPIQYVLKAEVINYTSNITKIGISADTDKLDFGRLIVNRTNTTKIIEISNPLSYHILVSIIPQGNITAYLILKRKLLVAPKITKKIYIKFYGKKIGNYTGTLKVMIKYPINKLSEYFMVKEYELFRRK